MGRPPEELCPIAKIVGAQGNKGEVKAIPLTDFSERFASLREVFISTASQTAMSVEVEGTRFKGNLVILKLKGKENIEDALALRGGIVQVCAAQRVRLPPGHYLHADLLGMRVEREDGSWLGILREIWAGKANDVYVVRRAGAVPSVQVEGGELIQGEREVLLPATKEVVREVDVPGKRMVVRLIPGMEDWA